MREQDHRTSYLIRRGVIVYVFALSFIAAFAIAFHFLTDSIVHRQQTTAQIVNISGRQRMLSQRIARLALERATHAPFRPDAETQAALRDAVTLMEGSHASLLHGSPDTGVSVLDSPAVSEVYLHQPWRLDDRMREFLNHAHAVANKPDTTLTIDDPDLRDLETEAQAPLLNASNAAVDAISQASEADVRHLRRVLATLTISILVILTLEALFLYRPLFIQLASANRELILTGRTDVLTGCLNRRGFADEAHVALLEARESKSVVSVLMIDIDRFKSINDTYGHAAGDQVINAVALALLGRTRRTNTLSRMGGEEFSVIMRGTPLEGAAIGAENLRHAVEAIALNLGKDRNGPILKVTISVGVATLRDGDHTLFHTLNRADKALYRAKLNGRNRVEREESGGVVDTIDYPRHSRV